LGVYQNVEGEEGLEILLRVRINGSIDHQSHSPGQLAIARLGIPSLWKKSRQCHLLPRDWEIVLFAEELCVGGKNWIQAAPRVRMPLAGCRLINKFQVGRGECRAGLVAFR
jgi:hypothetical protein